MNDNAHDFWTGACPDPECTCPNCEWLRLLTEQDREFLRMAHIDYAASDTREVNI